MYATFAPQEYLNRMDPVAVRKVARFRCRMVLCKGNQKSAHADLLCRAGCVDFDTQEHLVNCPTIHGDNQVIVDTSLFTGDVGNIDPEVIRALVEKLTIVEEWK